MSAATPKIRYRVRSVSSYEDQADQIVENNISRPKRKTQVIICPVADSASGIFGAMDVTGSSQPRPGQSPSPSEITLTFVENTGAFPWGVGDELELTKAAASAS